MKITKKTLENMIRETLENRFNMSEEEAPDVVGMASTSLPGEVKRVLNIPRASEILNSLADAIESQKSPQIKANVYTLILQAIGLDTVDELQAFRTLIQSRLAKAEKDAGPAEEPAVDVPEEPVGAPDLPSPEDIDPAALAENNDFTSILKKMVQQELKTIKRK